VSEAENLLGMGLDHPDAGLDMAVRHELNGFADKPADFYLEGLVVATGLIPLGPETVLLDVGCNTGKFFVDAADAAEVSSHLIGLDPLIQPYKQYGAPRIPRTRFSFMQAAGEHIPLEDSSVDVASAHLVLFRTGAVQQVLAEMKRVTRPDGLIIISTNGRNQARTRYGLERDITRKVAAETGLDLEVPKPPADGVYLGDLPRIIAENGGLELVAKADQKTVAHITAGERLDLFRTSLNYSANRIASLPPEYRAVWRRVAQEAIDRTITVQTARRARAHPDTVALPAPYLTDTVHRGMRVYFNTKPASDTPTSAQAETVD
jgi:SAM-dependent methyltransferase